MSVMLRSASCSTCPFRGGFHLSEERRAEIQEDVMVRDLTFSCHSEVRYVDGEEGVTMGDTSTSRQCAGASTLTNREGSANQVMRLAHRLEHVDMPDDPAIPFQDWDEWVNEPGFSDGRRAR